MDRYSFLGGIHSSEVEMLYEQYLQNPDAMEPSWRAFFQGFDFANEDYAANGDTAEPPVAAMPVNGSIPDNFEKEFRVLNLIQGYRTRGHLFTKTNPVRERRKYSPTLDLSNFGLSDADLDTVFNAGSEIGIGAAPLREIIMHLEKIYCESIGVEYMYIRKPEMLKWVQDWLMVDDNHPTLTPDDRRTILGKLNEAVAFESFLHTKYVGQKRFSLEGAEALIPAMDNLITKGAEHGVEEFVVGMAHRGRLNVLANIFGKSYQDIFSEFEGKDFEEQLFDGDVKYHLGWSSNTVTKNGRPVKVNLAPNPSHLETVDPVVEGIARAKINLNYDSDESKVLPILIHGDAAISGQGVVYEVVQMAQLKGYRTGGTIHIVINNQVGFTTNYIDGRSSTYCTDVGKVTLSPVMHVNVDDVEAVVHAMNFALEFRMKFHRDVFIDLLGYRRYGHNEGDEPRFTQPKLYKTIAKHPNSREIYIKQLVSMGVIEEQIAREMQQEFKKMLESDFDLAKTKENTTVTPFMEDLWSAYRRVKRKEAMAEVDTTVELEQLKYIAQAVTSIPEGKKFLRKVERLLADRKKMVEQTDKIDWGMAETLAYGALLDEGFNVRVSGQDVERGTFSHRHAIMKVEDSEEEICLLNQISDQQGNMSIYNSSLSEYGVMGFDYGYAMAAPKTLVIWEAQFGDFSNGAQIMMDQYLSAAEDKWKIQNGLVLLLPHGYEGQGAEHSSGRMERYLQLCARENMIVADCTTPANFFHLLRRQMKRDFRKPLIVFTPKSLLRHPKCVSSMNDLANGKFETVIDDQVDRTKVKKLVFVTGKFFYDLAAEREALNRDDIALVRLEQLYPLDKERLQKIVESYPNAEEHIWAQEEPENMGAWSYLLRKWPEMRLKVVSPAESAATAAGSAARAARRHKEAIDRLFETPYNK